MKGSIIFLCIKTGPPLIYYSYYMSFTCATSDLFDHYIIKALALKSCDEFIFLKQFIFIQNVVIVKHISCSSTLKKEKVA